MTKPDVEKAYIRCPKCDGLIDATKPDRPAIGFDTYKRKCPDCGFEVIFPYLAEVNDE